MDIATALVDLVRAAIFAAAHLLGGSIGAGVLAVSITLRVALLPLTLRLARRAGTQRRILASIKPELAQLSQRYRTDPEELWRRTLALYRRAGYRPLDPAALLGGLAQVPVLGAVYGALRRGLGAAASFLWIADLGRPDVLLAVAVAGLAGAASFLGAHAAAESVRGAWITASLGVALTLLVFWHASAGLLLSWGASVAVNIVQGAVLVRERRQRGAQ